MCGIYLHINTDAERILYYTGALSHRGPDEKITVHLNSKDGLGNGIMEFSRLAINGSEQGSQPFYKNGIYLMANAEIYNYRELEEMISTSDASYRAEIANTKRSDCAVLLDMYMRYGPEEMLMHIQGEFAFCIVDCNKKMVYFARDHVGIKPLYVYYSKINLVLSSEIKGGVQSGMVPVLPRKLYGYNWSIGSMAVQDYAIFMATPLHNDVDSIYSELRESVIKRLKQSDREIGFFLSGGLDSSIITSIAFDYLFNLPQKTAEQSEPLRGFPESKKYKPQLFTVAFDENAPDALSAREMVEYLRVKYGRDAFDWHLVRFKPEDAVNAIKPVIYALETYCTTTIRASVPMYLLSNYIANNTNVRVVLSGEGSDELFGGYLYFKYAPDDFSYRAEIINLLNNLHLFDVLRADRCTAAFGLEIRPPFLDRALINTVLHCAGLKNPGRSDNTKPLLRAALRGRGLLPESILEGRKEAFSDAVGYNWKAAITRHAEEKMAELHNYNTFSPHIPPQTAEQKYYQYLFNSQFSGNWHITPFIWLPNQEWVNTGSEPSATALDVYANTFTSESLNTSVTDFKDYKSISLTNNETELDEII